jgi:cytochrome b
MAAAFFLAYVVVEEPLAVHVWAGYLIGALIAIRLVWGLVGPRHARFTEFVPSPGGLKRYLLALVRGRERRYLGHNPAGGAMIVALLLALSATVVSGLMVYGAEEKAGPLGGLYAAGGPAPIATARADDDHEGDDGHEEAEGLEEFHEVSANLTLALVLLHIAGVGVTSLRHRENLARAMISGRKRSAAGEDQA